MPISRRNLIRQLGGSAAAAAAIPSLHKISLEGALRATRATQPDKLVRLDKNENPYGPSERVVTVMREGLNYANRYPSSESDALKRKIASFHSVGLDQVVLGCGSSEVLHMASTAFLAPGKRLILASPTFHLMAHYAENVGAEIVAVPLNKEYSHDLDTMLARTDSSTGLVYICNPNNPTGSLTPRKELEAFIHGLPPTTYVLIDEAYHHYVGGTLSYASFIDRPIDDSRVIVTRTLSKIYGLAGLRVGYAIAAPATAHRLSRDQLQFDVNIFAAKAAVAALDDTEHVRTSAKRNEDDRQEFFNQANARMLRAIDSHTNFVLLNTGRPAQGVIEHFQKNNILLGPRVPSMEKYIRVSLGKPEEMQEFWRVWDLLPPHGMSM